MVVIQPLSNRLMKPNLHVSLSHRRTNTVSLEIRNLLTGQKSGSLGLLKTAMTNVLKIMDRRR